jgi:hypothetical protein
MMPKKIPRRDLLKATPLAAAAAIGMPGPAGAAAVAAEPPPGAIREPARDVPIAHDCDVCAVEGSCGGAS